MSVGTTGGAQPFVYGEVMGGEFAGKTFYAGGLVRTATTYQGRKAGMVDVGHEAVRPSPAPTATLDPAQTD